MTDPNSSTSSASSNPPNPPNPTFAFEPRPARSRRAIALLWLAVLVVFVAAAVGAYALNRKVDRANDAAQARVQDAQRQVADMHADVTRTTDTVRQLEAQVAQAGGRLADAQAHQQALEHMYQELTSNRDDWTLAETEATLSMASQQLELTGNVKLALYALQSADQRLAASTGARVVAVRKALAADIAALKEAPGVDLAGLAVKLDDAVAQVDAMPLAADIRAPATAETAEAASAAASASTSTATSAASSAPAPASASDISVRAALARVGAWWHTVTASAGQELRTLVQVRRVDDADAMLVAPDQAYFLRGNLKLRLLSARLSLLARNQDTLQADLKAANADIARYFDPSAPSTRQVRATLDEIARAGSDVALPTLAASLQAVHQYKAGN